MPRLSTGSLLAALFIGALVTGAPAEAATVVAQQGDASIAHDAAAGTWTLATAGASLTLALDPSRDFAIVSLLSASGTTWNASAAADTVVRIGGRTLAFGNRPAGFTYRDVAVVTHGNTLRLDATFGLQADNLTLTRHYAIVPGAPAFEAWTTYEGAGASLADLNALQITVPNGVVHWLTGLQGDTANVPTDSAFTLQQQTLATGQSLALGATHRASEKTVPWFSIDGARDEFYAALMWSGAWSAAFNRAGAGTTIAVGLAPMSTSVSTAVDGPHVVFGVVPGGVAEGTAALRSYVLDGIRDGRPIVPLVTYNTWFAYGTEIDEASMRAEMERAAALGVELFVIDAGWYAGTGAAGPFDFDAGLGGWTADPARFPNGLAPLREYAHSLGLRFGLWVEPERVNLSLVGAPGVEETWLATEGGQYGSDHAGQICLASAAARQWLMDRLTTLIDDVQPDYLKWDNNMFVNCDREGHGHGATDGNFAHTGGLYDMLSQLRARYPDLLDRERLWRRQPARRRHAPLHRRRLDGRPHRAVGARAPQPAGPQRGVSAGLPAVIRDRPRHRAAARLAGPVALLPQPHGRRARALLPRRWIHRGRERQHGPRDRHLQGRARDDQRGGGIAADEAGRARRRTGMGRPAGKHGRARSDRPERRAVGQRCCRRSTSSRRTSSRTPPTKCSRSTRATSAPRPEPR